EGSQPPAAAAEGSQPPASSGAGAAVASAGTRNISTAGLESYEVQIDTFAELQTVLTSAAYNDVSVIYLNNDIAFGATTFYCNASRVDFSIVGHPKDNDSIRHTIQDRAGYAVRVGKNGRHVTLIDMDIRGYNYYGSIIFEGTSDGVYELVNVDYIGSQLIYNIAGTTIIRDSRITIGTVPADPVKWPSPGTQDPREEVAQTKNLEFSGTCVVTKNAGTLMMFEFNSTGARHLTVQAGSDVSLEMTDAGSTSEVFYLGSSGATGPALDIGAGASLSVHCRRFTTGTASSFEPVVLAAGSRLSINQTVALNADPVFCVYANMTVGPGAVLDIQRPTNATSNYLVYFRAVGSLVFNNPKRVHLYDPRAVLLCDAAGRLDISGSVGAINTRTSADNTNSATVAPNNYWNKADGSNLQFTAAVTYTNTTAAALGNLNTPEDFASNPFDTTSFSMANIRMLAMGSYQLGMDQPHIRSTVIDGWAEPGASLRVEYRNSGQDRSLAAVAASDGAFSVQLPDAPLPEGAVVTAIAYHDYLSYRYRAAVARFPHDKLLMFDVPEVLDFGVVQLTAGSQLVSRDVPSWNILVVDTRNQHSPWRLEASIDGPLRAELDSVSYTLPDALVFVDEQQEITALSETPVVVYEDVTDVSSQTNVTWADDKGLLLRVNPGAARVDLNYSTTIEWSLVDAP
ncbi:MAG: hypothetical protein FWF71_02410, partial [Actinomycetia bacterium]|nr:hypothetical protein [Actinomycetes bacterium]